MKTYLEQHRKAMLQLYLWDKHFLPTKVPLILEDWEFEGTQEFHSKFSHSLLEM